MLCDSCDRGWHGLCLSPPILPHSRTKARWTCPTCQAHVNFFDPPKLDEGRTKRQVGPPPIRPVSAMSALGEAREKLTTREREREEKRRRRAMGLDGGEGGKGEQGEGAASGERRRKRDRKGKQRALEGEMGGTGDWSGMMGSQEDGAPVFGGSSLKLTLGAGAGGPRPPKKARQEDAQPWLHQLQQQPEEPVYEEEEEEEDEEPYGGILKGEQASTEGRIPGEDDRGRWSKSREEAEVSYAFFFLLPRPPRSEAPPLSRDEELTASFLPSFHHIHPLLIPRTARPNPSASINWPPSPPPCPSHPPSSSILSPTPPPFPPSVQHRRLPTSQPSTQTLRSTSPSAPLATSALPTLNSPTPSPARHSPSAQLPRQGRPAVPTLPHPLVVYRSLTSRRFGSANSRSRRGIRRRFPRSTRGFRTASCGSASSA